MRRPAQIAAWLSEEELLGWLREAPDRPTYQRRLAIWLTWIKPLHAEEVAQLLGVSKQAVWLWIGQYNKQGPAGLERPGRGGRRWSLLEWEEEKRVLGRLEKRAQQGEVITARQLLPEVQKAVGQEVSLAYLYKLMKRHGWRKTGPRPRHVKASGPAQEAFEKNSRFSSKKRS
jgi:transposase